ncbi:hypothetical protein GGR56DRAFT_301414 [Xylariaceae sp. FL0804]|nr:hypothetical protein GGR56DRAFT_301414 [Xylariaceae sp. FL0804]
MISIRAGDHYSHLPDFSSYQLFIFFFSLSRSAAWLVCALACAFSWLCSALSTLHPACPGTRIYSTFRFVTYLDTVPSSLLWYVPYDILDSRHHLLDQATVARSPNATAERHQQLDKATLLGSTTSCLSPAWLLIV